MLDFPASPAPKIYPTFRQSPETDPTAGFNPGLSDFIPDPLIDLLGDVGRAASQCPGNPIGVGCDQIDEQGRIDERLVPYSHEIL